MKITAQHRDARMSPRKIRLLRAVVRGLPAAEARQQLHYLPGKAAHLIREVLASAVANAQHNFDIAEDKLVIADVIVDGGLVMKRFRPVSRGMAHPILKRSSHITVVLAERGESTQRTRKVKKTEISTVTPDQLLAQ